MTTQRSALPLPFHAAPRDAGEELGYTLGWDLITAVDHTGAAVARVVSFAPDRALIVFDDRCPPPRFEGELVFPEGSGLGPVRARQVGPISRHLAGDHVATVEVVGSSLAIARLQLAWLRARVRRDEALPPVTRHLQFERIQDPQRVARILSMLRHTEAPVTVQGTGEGNGAPVHGRIDRHGALLLPWDRLGRVDPPLRVFAAGYNSVYELVWPDSSAFAATPQEIVRIRRRQHRRVAAPHRVTVAFKHSQWPELVATRPVLDLSAAGLAFRTDTALDALYPGLELTVTVDWKRGRRYRFRAMVRHCTPGTTEASDVCGMSLHAMDDQTEREWQAELETVLHPTTHVSPPASDLWELYAESGYFRLSDKSAPEFAPLRRDFDGKRARIARAPQVAVHLGHRVGGDLQCVMSQIEAWSGSWLLFQVARRAIGRPLAAAGDDVLRDLYMHAYEHVLGRPDARHLVTYVQDVARFSRRGQHEFGTRLAASGFASVTPFRAIEMQIDATVPATPSRDESTLARADPLERELVAQVIARSRPIRFVEATGLGDRRLELGAVADRWHSAGLHRTREVIVARDRGVTEAALIVDAADDGLHLFGLLDVARFVPLSEQARGHLPALLAAAAHWYARVGKRKFVYFEESEPALLPACAGARDLGLAHCVVIPIEFLSEQVEHIFEITAPRI